MSDSEDDWSRDEYGTWHHIPFDELTPAQWQTRAIEMFLERAGRSDLQAVPNSFRTIANVESIYLNGIINSEEASLRVVPDCINLLTGLRWLNLYNCELILFLILSGNSQDLRSLICVIMS